LRGNRFSTEGFGANARCGLEFFGLCGKATRGTSRASRGIDVTWGAALHQRTDRSEGLFLGGFLLGEFVVDVLLEDMRVCAIDAPAIDEEGRRAADIEFLAVGNTGVHFGGGLRAAHTGFEGVNVETGASGVVEHLVPGIRSRNDVLIIVDKVVHLPEGFGILLVGATAGNGGGASPGVQGFERKILEDDFDLRIVGKQSPESIVKAAADGTFKVRVFDDGDGGFGIAKDGSIRELEFGDVFSEGIASEVVKLAAKEIAAILGEVHLHGVGTFGRLQSLRPLPQKQKGPGSMAEAWIHFSTPASISHRQLREIFTFARIAGCLPFPSSFPLDSPSFRAHISLHILVRPSFARSCLMSYFCHQVSYTKEAWARLMQNPQDRLEAVRAPIEKLGGKIHSSFFAFGAFDVLVITEFSDNISAAAISIAFAAGGAVANIQTTLLLTAAQTVEALRKAGTCGYRSITADSASGTSVGR